MLPATGYGDLSATNVQEMLYAVAVMLVGKLLFGFILGSIASTLANLDTQRVLFEEKLNALKVQCYIPLVFSMQVHCMSIMVWIAYMIMNLTVTAMLP